MWVKAAARRALQDVSKVKPKAPASHLGARHTAEEHAACSSSRRSIIVSNRDRSSPAENMTVRSVRLETSHPPIVQQTHRCRCSLDPRSSVFSIILLFCISSSVILLFRFTGVCFVISRRISGHANYWFARLLARFFDHSVILPSSFYNVFVFRLLHERSIAVHFGTIQG